MFIHYRTKGLIFKKENQGEADQVFTVYTKDFGKLEILGKGIRKISSKLRSGADIFYLSEIEFVQGKKYKTLTDAILIKKFKNIWKDLNKLIIANKVSEILDRTIGWQEPDEKIWYFLIEVFEKIDNPQTSDKNLQLVYYYFLWNLLSLLGYQPQLYNCVICQKRLLPQKLYFSSKEGGIICQNCSKQYQNLKEIRSEEVKIIRKIFEKDWKTLSKLKNIKKYLKKIDQISQDYLLFIFEKINGII